jgi:hypothetical protein
VPGGGRAGGCGVNVLSWGVMAMSVEDLAEIERGGRRCSVCRSGRHWRRLEVVRSGGAEPVVMCGACRARYGSAPPVRERSVPAVAAVPAAAAAVPASRVAVGVASPGAGGAVSAGGAGVGSAAGRGGGEEREDRVKRVLRELPRGEHSTGRIAKAAGLNHAKTLRRLRELEASGGVREVGKRWSTEPPSSDLEGAFDRLAARTSNIRIVRDRSPVG